ncbi:hypothetical protein ACTQ49_13865 [Luteococcus sp. Sow4_B9]|uniref:hypothetical protein n=1 Tax=Luteococcus sp. Sow4_B9 TaxID=3438792 RepID=UPI003F9EB57B
MSDLFDERMGDSAPVPIEELTAMSFETVEDARLWVAVQEYRMAKDMYEAHQQSQQQD